MRCDLHLLGAELLARDLEDDAVHALADLGRGAMDVRRAVRVQHDPGGARVVEALGVAEVLVADGKTDPAPNALTARRVARAAREPERVARELLGLRDGQRSRALDHL